MEKLLWHSYKMSVIFVQIIRTEARPRPGAKLQVQQNEKAVAGVRVSHHQPLEVTNPAEGAGPWLPRGAGAKLRGVAPRTWLTVTTPTTRASPPPAPSPPPPLTSPPRRPALAAKPPRDLLQKACPPPARQRGVATITVEATPLSLRTRPQRGCQGPPQKGRGRHAKVARPGTSSPCRNHTPTSSPTRSRSGTRRWRPARSLARTTRPSRSTSHLWDSPTLSSSKWISSRSRYFRWHCRSRIFFYWKIQFFSGSYGQKDAV